MAIQLDSTLTETSKDLDMELIKWEGDTLTKIIDRCIMVATSFMEGAGEFPYPYQLEPMRRIFRSVLTNDGANITSLFARQMGKCLQKSTKVIRYDGTVDVVENIKEGDLLMGDDSTPRRVIGITKGIDELYKIVPKSPRAKPYVVNSNHTLSLIHNHRQKGKIKVDLPIAEVISGKYKAALKSSHLMGYQVPVTYQKLYAPLPIAPYTLGVWLGDGTSVCPSVTTMDKEIAELWYEEAKNRGLKVRETIKSGCSKAKTYHITGALSGRRVTNSFLDDLNTLNLINNKHIPDIYRLGSEQTRLEVLAGLIDTDGHKPKDPNAKYTCELTLKEGQLIEDVISLVRSLGFRAGVKTKIVKGKKYTRCYIYGDMWRIPTRVPHKKYEYSTPLKEEPLHYGFDIEPIGEGEYYGFSLDGNHRFLLEDFTVTHNSSFSAATIATLLIVAPLLSRQFPDKFPYFKKGIMIGVFAPTAEQVATTHARVEMMLSHDTSNAILNDPDIRGKKRYDAGIIKILGNPHKVNGVVESDWVSFVRFQTAAKQAKIESKSYQIIFCDETQEMDDTKIGKSIRPMLAAYNGTSVYTGTPSPYICEFYNAIMQNRAEDISKPDNLRNHYEYDYLVGGKYNIRYKKFVEGEKERLGEESDSFQMSYCLRWLTEKGMALSPADFQKYMSDGRSDIESKPISGFTYVAGLDLGKGIEDPSVLTIARLEKNGASEEITKKVVHWKEYSDRSWETQFAKILIDIRDFNISAIAVDATGKGDPIVDRLKATLVDESIDIFGVVFSTQSKHTLATDFYEEMFKHRIKIPSGKKTKNTKEFKKFYGEWLTAVKTFTGKYLQLEHPRDKSNAHDDYVDSLLLMIYAAKRTTASVVKREFVDWRVPTNNQSQMYRSAQDYAKVRVNELFNRGK